MRFAVTTALVAVCSAGCGQPDASRPAERAAPLPATSDWFVDEGGSSGLDFTHVNGMSGQFYMPEVLAPGVALFDYDSDGDLDVYLVQGQPLVGRRRGRRVPLPSGDRLFRNDLAADADGARHLKFVDVTAASRIAPRGYGMGVAAGDVDNDGRVDLYLTKFDAANELSHNNGDGTFTRLVGA